MSHQGERWSSLLQFRFRFRLLVTSCTLLLEASACTCYWSLHFIVLYYSLESEGITRLFEASLGVLVLTLEHVPIAWVCVCSFVVCHA